MRAIRIRAGVVSLILAIGTVACTSTSDTVDDEPTSSTTTSSPSETSALDAANARITELEAELFTATSTTVPLTTTTTLPQDLVVWSHQAGEYIVEPSVDWMWGWVSHPQAQVDVNGVPLAVTDQVGPERVSTVDPWVAAWEFGAFEEGRSVALRVGRNMLLVTATFPDGSTIVDDIVVFHDPALTTELGILVDTAVTEYEPIKPRTMTFGIGTEWQQPAGGGIDVESIETYQVADDAVFKLEAADTSGWRVLQVDEFYELLDFIESGVCSQCIDAGCACPNRCIWASWDGWEGLEFAIYLNPDGDIQQLTQLHLRN